MPRSAPVDGFSLAYDRHGEGPPVVLLHGWPGMRTDHRALVPLLDGFDVVVPDLRGFGESDKHVADPGEQYSAAGQARSVAGLLEELGLGPAVLVGYDVGSRVAQALARERPELVHALVLAPPLPGIGQRILSPVAMREFWYQPFHRLELAERLIDGNPDAVRDYLRHFWDHWGGPGLTVSDADLDALVEHYAPPGAFVASINWYRGGSGGVAMSLSEQVPDAGGPDRRPDPRPLARARPALPARVERPARRVLRRRHDHRHAGRRPLLPARGARRRSRPRSERSDETDPQSRFVLGCRSLGVRAVGPSTSFGLAAMRLRPSFGRRRRRHAVARCAGNGSHRGDAGHGRSRPPVASSETLHRAQRDHRHLQHAPVVNTVPASYS